MPVPDFMNVNSEHNVAFVYCKDYLFKKRCLSKTCRKWISRLTPVQSWCFQQCGGWGSVPAPCAVHRQVLLKAEVPFTVFPNPTTRTFTEKSEMVTLLSWLWWEIDLFASILIFNPISEISGLFTSTWVCKEAACVFFRWGAQAAPETERTHWRKRATQSLCSALACGALSIYFVLIFCHPVSFFY